VFSIQDIDNSSTIGKHTPKIANNVTWLAHCVMLRPFWCMAYTRYGHLHIQIQILVDLHFTYYGENVTSYLTPWHSGVCFCFVHVVVYYVWLICDLRSLQQPVSRCSFGYTMYCVRSAVDVLEDWTLPWWGDLRVSMKPWAMSAGVITPGRSNQAEKDAVEIPDEHSKFSLHTPDAGCSVSSE
jgi:hypothetical protein